jgi:hypothetical protein
MSSPRIGPAPFVLLGAGFSKAVSSAMPTLNELAPMVLDRLKLPRNTLQQYGGDLEQWLSYLSIDQPWLPDSENLTNRAMFFRASSAVRSAIQEAESTARSEPCPPWLSRLATSWCATGATVVSFNYDLLVERTVTELKLTQSWLDIYRTPLSNRSATLVAGMTFGLGKPPGPTLALLKLHGSINWGYAGINATSRDSIYLLESDLGWSDVEDGQPALPRHWGLHDDLEPMIVPPTGTKSSYYSSAGLRGQWRRAAAALQSATSITIVGYSFPTTDHAARHFFAGNAADVPITVVDTSPTVGATVQKVLGGTGDIRHFSGQDAVSKYVEATCGDVITWGADYSVDGFRLINGTKSVQSELTREYDIALADAGTLALDELPALNLNAEKFEQNELEAHWPGLRLAYKSKSEHE